MVKNYYFILGVAPNAAPAEIRAAYRQLAKELHPDHYTGGPQPFLDVQEAYNVLSDARQRSQYDRRLETVKTRPTAGPYRPEPLRSRPAGIAGRRAPDVVDLGEASLTRSFRSFTPSYDEIFDRLWSNFQELTRPKSERLERLTVEIPLTPGQAVRGGHVRVLVPARERCPVCHGSGGVAGYECLHCLGEGFLSGEYPLMVSFPPGIVNGYVLSVPLDRFGIRNFYLTVRFAVSEARLP